MFHITKNLSCYLYVARKDNILSWKFKRKYLDVINSNQFSSYISELVPRLAKYTNGYPPLKSRIPTSTVRNSDVAFWSQCPFLLSVCTSSRTLCSKSVYWVFVADTCFRSTKWPSCWQVVKCLVINTSRLSVRVATSCHSSTGCKRNKRESTINFKPERSQTFAV